MEVVLYLLACLPLYQSMLTILTIHCEGLPHKKRGRQYTYAEAEQLAALRSHPRCLAHRRGALHLFRQIKSSRRGAPRVRPVAWRPVPSWCTLRTFEGDQGMLRSVSSILFVMKEVCFLYDRMNRITRPRRPVVR